MRFKNLEGKPLKKKPKEDNIYYGEHGLIQMVSEPDTGQCANEDVGLPRRVDCEIPHRLERGAKHYL